MNTLTTLNEVYDTAFYCCEHLRKGPVSEKAIDDIVVLLKHLLRKNEKNAFFLYQYRKPEKDYGNLYDHILALLESLMTIIEVLDEEKEVSLYAKTMIFSLYKGVENDLATSID